MLTTLAWSARKLSVCRGKIRERDGGPALAKPRLSHPDMVGPVKSGLRMRIEVFVSDGSGGYSGHGISSPAENTEAERGRGMTTADHSDIRVLVNARQVCVEGLVSVYVRASDPKSQASRVGREFPDPCSILVQASDVSAGRFVFFYFHLQGSGSPFRLRHRIASPKSGRSMAKAEGAAPFVEPELSSVRPFQALPAFPGFAGVFEICKCGCVATAHRKPANSRANATTTF